MEKTPPGPLSVPGPAGVQGPLSKDGCWVSSRGQGVSLRLDRGPRIQPLGGLGETQSVPRFCQGHGALLEDSVQRLGVGDIRRNCRLIPSRTSSSSSPPKEWTALPPLPYLPRTVRTLPGPLTPCSPHHVPPLATVKSSHVSLSQSFFLCPGLITRWMVHCCGSRMDDMCSLKT